MKINIYGKPNCMKCELTKRYLDDSGVPYQYIDIYENEQALNFVKSLGYSGLPVIVADGFDTFNDMRPDMLSKIVKAFNANPSIEKRIADFEPTEVSNINNRKAGD